eukprot:365344-Chlamydomonas_euryale.AAC.12
MSTTRSAAVRLPHVLGSDKGRGLHALEVGLGRCWPGSAPVFGTAVCAANPPRRSPSARPAQRSSVTKYQDERLRTATRTTYSN